MPWKAIRVVDERIRFINAVLEDPRGNFTQLCARFGVSRDVGYKWLARYREHGPSGLDDKKSTPGSCPHRTADEVVDAVVAYRKKYPHDGPKKIRCELVQIHPELTIPAASTIGDILKRTGLVRPRRARLLEQQRCFDRFRRDYNERRPHEALGQNRRRVATSRRFA